MEDESPVSPEARLRSRARDRVDRQLARLGPGSRVYEVLRRVVLGVLADGFIHAGNLAYLTLLTLFPFFIMLAAVASLVGRNADTLAAVQSFLEVLPPTVGELLAKPIADVLAARTGSLLWLGGVVALWSVGSFIETIRDILRRAYGTPYSGAFYQYRLGSILVSAGAGVLVMLAFSAQVALTAVEQFIYRLLPLAQELGGWIGISRLAPALVMFGALYALIYSLTPSRYRVSDCPKWPGAAFVTVWWIGAMILLPVVLSTLGGYDLTYGSLAGVIIALFFFWLVGLGLVIGVYLNAALAEPPEATVKEPGIQA